MIPTAHGRSRVPNAALANYARCGINDFSDGSPLRCRNLLFTARLVADATRRALGFSPMQQVLRELRRRGVDVGSLNAIELFGGCAKRHTLDYAGRVAHLEVWEIDPTCEPALHRTIPSATIRIVDTYEEIRKTSDRFDLIVVDNPMSIYGGHCEHFDLFEQPSDSPATRPSL